MSDPVHPPNDQAPPVEPHRLRRAAVTVADAHLRSYAQILFTRSWPVGVLLMLCTAVSPRHLVAGILGSALALATARMLSLGDDQIRSGLFGYNALLLALGIASLYEPTPAMIGLGATAVIASVLVTAALHSALGSTWNLPVLTLPFIFVFTLVLAAAPSLGLALSVAASDPLADLLSLPDPLALYLRSLGALFFLPRLDAGLLVLAALCWYSRIGLLLSIMGFAIAHLLWLQLTELPDAMLPLVLGYNFILTALALGGVWFVPGLSSFLFAAAGSLMCGLLTVGLLPFLTWNGLPPLILPFNLTVLLLLYAMRQRTRDSRPKSVDFLLGTPEENLGYYRTRLRRFGSHYLIRFTAPFLGRWTCTQGVSGEQTHQGAWAQAFDFEVAGSDGQMWHGTGQSLKEFHCYRLPVLAAAAGTVAKVVDGVPDNPVGEVNLEQNWGNLVILYHGPGLYSMVCHLSPGTLKVREGQVVKAGEVLGSCGNSGRSAVPHIHFQLQATARVGAPTLHAELHNVVHEGDEPRFCGTFIPQKGQSLRNLEPQEDLARLLRFTYGEPLHFTIGDGGRRETLMPDIDLYGSLLIRSLTRSTTLVYHTEDTHFTVLDTLGRRGSVLALFQAALARVPFEATTSLTWVDVLPLRRVLPLALRLLLDLVSPFWPQAGLEVRYRAQRQGRTFVVTGESLRRWRGRMPLLSTRAQFSDDRGLEDVEVVVRGRRTRACRAEAGPANSSPPG